MMIFDRGNAAKQWMMEELGRRFDGRDVSILDLGCGDGHIWKMFVERHSQARVVGVDTDAKAIASGQHAFANEPRVRLEIFDAQSNDQRSTINDQPFDVVVALSTIEHVVDRPAFLQTVWNALKDGGIAYLNYDDGHFRSRDVKERLMVPVSQVLAAIGIEGSYMKRVDDDEFRKQAEAQGFAVLQTRKNNLATLKSFMKQASDEAIQAWFEFETRLNDICQPEELDRIMWSTTLVVEKKSGDGNAKAV